MKRLVAIDLARFVAIVGMMAAHLLVLGDHTGWLAWVTAGFPSTLFAVLGGFGLVFSSRRYLVLGQRRAAVAAGLTRGLGVVTVGLLLELLPPHPIAVVLVYFGSALMVGSLLVIVPNRFLILGLLAGSIAVPILEMWVKNQWEGLTTVGQLDYSSPQSFLISSWFTGTYPASTWSIYLALGIVVARASLEAANIRRSAGTMVAVGMMALVFSQLVSEWQIRVIADQLSQTGPSQTQVTEALHQGAFGTPHLSGWRALLIATPHSGSTADIFRTAGGAFVVIGVLLLVCGSSSRLPTLLRPVAKVGAIPLTSYSLHVAMTAFTVFLLAPGWPPISGGLVAALHTSFWWQLALLLLLGSALVIWGRRGPLEAAISHLSRTVGSLFTSPGVRSTSA